MKKNVRKKDTIVRKKRTSKYAMLYFDLTDPEARQDFKLANKASAMACNIWEADQKLRSIVKHMDNVPEEVIDAINEARSLLNEYGYE